MRHQEDIVEFRENIIVSVFLVAHIKWDFVGISLRGIDYTVFYARKRQIKFERERERER